MNMIARWAMQCFTMFLLLELMSSVAVAQHAVELPHPSLPSFLGYVEDEFIVVFTTTSRRKVSVTHGQGGKPQVNLPSVDALFHQFGVQRFQRQFPHAKPQGDKSRFVDLTGHYKAHLPTERDLNQALQAFAANPHVDHVEKIGVHTLSLTPNDPYYETSPSPSFPFDQWHYWASHGIDAQSAWDAETGDPSVLVGILDSGTRYFHQDLGGNSPPWGPETPFAGGNIFINTNETPNDGLDNDGNGFVDDTIGWDFVTAAGGIGVSCIDQDCLGADNDPDDGNGHGTHTSGTVGAITNNNMLVAGVAGGSGTGNGVKIVPLRIGYHAKYRGVTTGVVRMDWAAEAMNYLANLVEAGQNVAAVNCSWGSSNSGGLNAAVDNLLAHDVMIIHAAGNSNSSSPDFLGTKAGVMNVAATDRNGNGASFTNFGDWVDVAAPGVDIVSTYRNPDDADPTHHYIAAISGTSMSAPHVCGIAALLESCDASLTQSEKFSLIVNNANQYFDTRHLGSGIANADLALTAAGCSVACDILTDFSGTPTSGVPPLVVKFTDLSTGNGITSWSWDFGDGSTSTAQHPEHTYATGGTYTVSLTAFNSACNTSETKAGYISVSEAPIAAFSSNTTLGSVPLSVTFTDLSSGIPTSWLWEFGDGETATSQHPSHTYTTVGTYSVTLTATNEAGSDTITKVNYISVNEVLTPTTISVVDLVVSNESLGKGQKRGVAVVTIHDEAGNPVADATVTGNFTGKTINTGLQGVTNAAGQIKFFSDSAHASGGREWCFEVSHVTHATLSYNSTRNLVTQSCESGDVL